ncbi:glutamate receptor 3.6-like [Ziziphus jujuba]|uniref:Glutamate receptor n=1 Tax=Ziziphus jujuba TaxID=326968 RepID=A0ABM4AEK9_ZIZJJ|nr:glutamate receptor 3.6-like [Ziziphus jujuba]
MIIVWLMLLMVFSNGFSSNGIINTTRPNFVNIGAILSFNSSIGKVAKVAIEAAVEDVNSNSSILNGTKLRLAMQDTKYSDFLGIVEALSFMENETVAIIGPQFSVTARVISHIANELHVPLLSFAATDFTLTSLQFPYFIRTTQSDLHQMAAVAELVSHYEWRDVIAIYIDDDFGRNGIVALGDQLAEKRCKISYKAPLSPNKNPDEITSVLHQVSLMESRILVLHICATWGLQVLRQAKILKMMETGFVWIATDWLSTILDTDPSLLSKESDNLQGVLTLRMHTPESPRKADFINRWSNLTTKGRKVDDPFGLNTYGLYAYDSVWLLAQAIDSFFINGGKVSFSNDSSLRGLHGRSMHLDAMSMFDGGESLLHSILQVNTTGVTGPIRFDTDKNIVNPAYEIINVIGTGVRRIGYWSNSSGFSTSPPRRGLKMQFNNTTNSSQQLYGVIWPGQTTQKPRGWVFPNNGRQLRIVVPLRISYRDFVSRVDGSSDAFSGYCIDVFTAALDQLPYGAPSYKFVPYGDGHTNPSVTGLLHMVAQGSFDALVGDVTITTSRAKMVDFTQPYIESGLVVVAPIRKLNSSAWAFLRPFSAKMWCVTGIFFLVVGVVVWILERRTNNDFRGSPRRQVVRILWFSFSTLFISHNERTGSTLARFVLIIWLFVVLVLTSSYTASLTSILTVEQLSSPVKGIESLVTSNEPIGYTNGSFALNYLTDELNVHRSRLVPFNSPEEFDKALKAGPSRGGVAAVIDERAYMELFLSTRCEYSIVGQEFTKMGWGFAFPRDSPLAADMSTAILKLSENGILQRIHDKWLRKSACSSEGAKQDVDRLEIKSFWGLFLLSGTACILALLLYFIKTMYQFSKYTRGTSQSSSLRLFLQFLNQKEDVQSRSKRRRSESLK